MPAKADGLGESIEEKLVLTEPLHARPAGLLVRTMAGREATVVVSHGERQADARSVLALMGLGADTGATVTITASGPDAASALEAAATVLKGAG